MTTVYELGYDFSRVTAFALTGQTQGVFSLFDGRSLADSWVPPAVQPADMDEDDAQLGDCTVLGTVPLLSRRAADALFPIIETSAELLPVHYPRAALSILNVLGTSDCLDESRSEVERFPTGRVMRVTEYVFHPHKLPKARIFRLPQLLRAHLYVTDGFVSAVQQSDLTGFEFTPVWSSDAGR